MGTVTGNDGSLSVYCGMKGIRYINIEYQYKSPSEKVNEENFLYQTEMLEATLELLKTKTPQ